MRRANVLFTQQFLLDMLKLPEGTRIRDAKYDFPTDCIILTLEHDALPDVQVPDVPQLPVVRLQYERDIIRSSFVLPKT